jgi:hypothetical protein
VATPSIATPKGTSTSFGEPHVANFNISPELCAINLTPERDDEVLRCAHVALEAQSFPHNLLKHLSVIPDFSLPNAFGGPRAHLGERGQSMKTDVEAPRVFLSGWYVCPVTKERLPMETEVPRAWVEWPATVKCSSCKANHVLQYEDVFQPVPAFGFE